jgi:hypothetical protein
MIDRAIGSTPRAVDGPNHFVERQSLFFEENPVMVAFDCLDQQGQQILRACHIGLENQFRATGYSPVPDPLLDKARQGGLIRRCEYRNVIEGRAETDVAEEIGLGRTSRETDVRRPRPNTSLLIKTWFPPV